MRDLPQAIPSPRPPKFVERFAARIPTVGGVFIQMEDELTAQEAHTRFAPELRHGGKLEQDLVRVNGIRTGTRAFGVPATRLAEELGRKVVLNIVMVEFFAAVTGLLDPDALRKAV